GGVAVRVAISADHAGLPLRARVAQAVTDAGHEPVLLGPDTAPPEGIDYPVIAKLVGDCLAAAEAERGILVCGSGAGVTIAANRLPGVRAAYGSDHYTAHQMVEHDHVNVLTLGSRVMGPEVAADVVAAFVGATPSTEARHLRRLGEVLEFERERSVNAAVKLHDVGQSLWLDNITRDLLASGTLARYIGGLAVTGLTSNPTIFDKAVTGSDDYDDQIRLLAPRGLGAESLFFELAITDLTKAASLFRPIWDATEGVDGWVSLEVSPKLAYDTDTTTQAAKTLHGKAATPNLFIKIPGTPAGIPAIEEAISAGVPVNVTLLFSREHYLAAAEAYMRGLERRLAEGLDLGVGSVASVFISRWDVAVAGSVPDDLRGLLGVAIAERTYKAYRDLLVSERWQALAAAGAKPQRLLWASTGVKDPALPDTFYIRALASDQTVNTMPENTLLAFGAHGSVGDLMPADGGDAEAVLLEFAAGGVDVDALAARLQSEGASSFVKSWEELIAAIESKASLVTTSA
ncbi:MAG: transaldolase, partial [Actinomycetota bacterium]|nr:transaldolase [Actinomycetota bacterium]